MIAGRFPDSRDSLQLSTASPRSPLANKRTPADGLSAGLLTTSLLILAAVEWRVPELRSDSRALGGREDQHALTRRAHLLRLPTAALPDSAFKYSSATPPAAC